jgi:hypothetical protein
VTLLLAALGALLLPQVVKRRPGYRHLGHPGVHVVVATLEVLALVALYLLSARAYAAELNAALQDADLQAHLAERSSGERVGFMMGAPVFTLLTHAITPRGFALGASIVWGVMRALDAGFNQGCRGPLVVELVAWLGRRLGLKLGEVKTASALGEERADVLVAPHQSESGQLELHCNRDKPFTEVQVARFGGQLFRLDGRDERQGPRGLTLIYRFRPLQPWEQVQGEVVELG